MIRRKISHQQAERIFGKKALDELKKKYPKNRPTFWSDGGLTYGTINDWGCIKTVISQGVWMGQD